MIRVEKLDFTYPKAPAQTLFGLDFEVGAGEVFGLLGPSGAGKSTTQSILIGLRRGHQGRVEIMDKAIEKWRGELYREIGVSFELPNHYLKLSARENLEYFRRIYGGEARSPEEVMALVGLEDAIDKPVGDFSKGMKNRLNLARSMLHRPRIWFLDEPTSGLDPVNVVRVRELIAQARDEGVTVVLTTHDMKTAEEVCDRVAFIVDGRLAAIDSPEALRRAHGRREVEVRWSADDGVQTRSFAFENLADDPAFLAALREPGLRSVHSQEASLESVFVEVTGRSIR